MANVSTGRLKELVAQATGLSREAVSQVIDSLFGVIEEQLRQGHRVELRNLVSFRVDDAGPHMARNPNTGLPLLVPLRRRVRTRVSSTLRKQVAGAPGGAGIFISRDDDLTASELLERLERLSYRLETFPTVAAAHRKLGRKLPGVDFVVIGMPIEEEEYGEIIYLLKMSSATASVPIVRMMIPDWETTLPQRARIEPDELVESIDEVMVAIRDNVERWREERQLFQRLVHVRGPSDLENIERAGGLMSGFVERVLESETEAFKLASACREAIERAGRLGNRESRDRYLDIQLLEDRERMTLIIQDEGQGFDRQAAAARRGWDGGPDELGLTLIESCTDHMEFEEGGHRLILVKFKSSEAVARGG